MRVSSQSHSNLRWSLMDPQHQQGRWREVHLFCWKLSGQSQQHWTPICQRYTNTCALWHQNTKARNKIWILDFLLLLLYMYVCDIYIYILLAFIWISYILADATKITLAPSNADINQGENVTLQCHASHDPTMDLTFTWALNGVLLDMEDPARPYHRVEGVSPVIYEGRKGAWDYTLFVCLEDPAKVLLHGG